MKLQDGGFLVSKLGYSCQKKDAKIQEEFSKECEKCLSF